MSDDPRRIDLSLVSHTNAGKTTLARTLLGRDIGEVRDEAHVTALAEVHTLIEEGQAVLRLWDTPGFGDSARLVKRLRLQGNPIGWFLTQVWDRWRDRPFWSSQQAIKNVRAEADVALYLVNAAEDPRDAGYVAAEMEILEWLGKPVLLLLNQVGTPRPVSEEAAEQARWRAHVARHPFVRKVLTLDAFARCWVQEFTLLDAVGEVLPAAKQLAFGLLAGAWRRQRQATFEAAIEALTASLLRVCQAQETMERQGLTAVLRQLGKRIGLGQGGGAGPQEQAMARLAERLDGEVRTVTDQLIRLHGLRGEAAEEVLARLASRFAVDERVSEGKSAMLGGLVSGALSGLAADLAAGGLSLGAGLLTGAVLGALGGAGLAKGYNVVRGREVSSVRWSEEALNELFASSLLRYLAVAHFGRGRGNWQQAEYPPWWQQELAPVMEARRAALKALWAERGSAEGQQVLEAALRSELRDAALELLERLYPGVGGQGTAAIGYALRPTEVIVEPAIPYLEYGARDRERLVAALDSSARLKDETRLAGKPPSDRDAGE